jgi:hypothetical protein
MRGEFSETVEAGRQKGRAGYPDTARGQRQGVFVLSYPLGMRPLLVVASDGGDWVECGLPGPAWEHVSVSLRDRPPTWEEMAWVKHLFWDEEECVVQFHPPRSRYVNTHPFCLHLWAVVGVAFPTPPLEAV